MDLITFLDRYPDQDACIAHLEAVRWPEGTVCPKCGAVAQATKLPRYSYWQCRACRAQFNVLNGTAMEGTHLPLRAWFAAIYLTATSGNGVSAMVLSRQLAVGYKTAWLLAHRLRSLMTEDWEALNGLVEVDETYLGAKRQKHSQAGRRDSDGDQPGGRAGAGKVVVGVERGAKARRGRSHAAGTRPG